MVVAEDRAVVGRGVGEEQLLGAEPMERSTPEWQRPEWVTPPFVLAQSHVTPPFVLAQAHVTPPFVLPRAAPAGPPFVLAQRVVRQHPRGELAKGGQVVALGHEGRPNREGLEQG